ncbi:hypothetical protein ACHAWF_018761 [Thalassiosira exigua]
MPTLSPLSEGGAMTKERIAPARRTSSLAYDGGSGGKYGEKYISADAWRKRRGMPPKPASWAETALASASTSASSSAPELDDGVDEGPLITFGVLADIQYAPIPDGKSYAGNPRYYRHAKKAAEHAARHFQEERVQCVVNLGDIVDGKCADVERWGGVVDSDGEGGGGGFASDEEEKKTGGTHVGVDAIDDVLRALSSYDAGRILHTYGNHELYNLSRRDLGDKLSIPFKLEPTNDLVGYYDHLLHPHRPDRASRMKLRFVVLDSYDVCLLDRCPDTSPKRRLAHELLVANNPNYPEDENSPEGLQGLSRRYVAFNGGIDAPQMEWLEQSLQTARDNDEKVIVCSHQPIHPDSTWPTCLIWNYDEVLTKLREYSDVVIASFSGHAHKGGYVRDEASGVHFRVFPATLESPEPIRTYAMVDLWHDRLVVRGWGDCVSDVYDLDHLSVELDDCAYTKEARL